MVLRALLVPSEAPDMHSEAMRLLSGKAALPLRISHVAIGEAFNGICEDHGIDCDGQDCALISFNRLVFRGELLEVKGIHDVDHFLEMAEALHRADERLDPNDCLILALAIADEECDSFLTSDPVMVRSAMLREMASDHRKEILPFGVRHVVRNRRRHFTGRGRQHHA